MVDSEKQKVVAAIQAAVAAYMEEEELPVVTSISSGPRLWSLAGRQSIMSQRGIFHTHFKK